MAHHFQGGEGALWAQISGPNTPAAYLGCHALGDVDEPQGDIELIYCPDPSGPNRYRVVGSTQGAAGAITTTVTADVADELDYLERVRCPFTLFVHMVETGRKDVFTNYKRSFILVNARVTSRGLTNLAARTPDDNGRSEQTFDLSGEMLIRVVDLSINRQSIAEPSSINDISFCNEERCRTNEVAAQGACEVGYAVGDTEGGSPSATSNVLKTINGATWTATEADPFATAENLVAVTCFDLGRGESRVLVARGAAGTDEGEIAYSDDGGDTWNVVEFGAVASQYVPHQHSLFALDQSNMWLGTNDGYIYFSDSSGLDWDILEAAVIQSGAWNAVEFVDENVGWAAGAANVIARTVDGGVSWSVVTGPTAQAAENIIALAVLDRNRAWIGYGNGRIYFTTDAGVNWEERAFSGNGVGEIRDIKFLPGTDLLGYIVHNNATPVGRVLRTIDGGQTWEPITTPTNAGLNALVICDQWSFFVVGEQHNGYGYIAKGAL